MTRCQHCNKLTHSEDLEVFFKTKDYEKVQELMNLERWTPSYQYASKIPHEVGKLKLGDIWIHFIEIK